MNKLYDILPYLPERISEGIISSGAAVLGKITDIRLRTDCPAVACTPDGSFFITSGGLSGEARKALYLFRHDAEIMLMKISDNSLYAHEDALRSGYITVKGGHRVGLTGSASVSGGHISAVRDINGFYFRIAREVRGCADNIVNKLISDGERAYPLNTVIISPPGKGKTTFLRDCARVMSEKGFRVCVVDERSEIGMSDPSVLPLCAVLDGYPKAEGIITALRSLSPQLIVTDEIGSREDLAAIAEGIRSGTSFAVTAHSDSPQALSRRVGFEAITESFDVCIIPDYKNGNYVYEYVNLKEEWKS